MRRLALFTGGFALGVFLAQYLLAWDVLLFCALLALILAAAGRVLLRRDPGTRAVLCALGLALGLGWNWLYVRQVQLPMEALAGAEVRTAMTVLDYPEPAAYGVRITAAPEGLPGKVVLYGDSALADLRPGQTLRGLVRFSSAARIREDDLRSFTSRGVFLLAYPRGELAAEEGSAGSPRWWPARAGRAMGDALTSLYEPETAAFLTAILTGEKNGLSAQTQADFSESGLYHILAVSGMHCGFLLLLIRAAVGRHRRRTLAGVSALALVFYALLTGGRPSVVRACVMLLLLLAAPLFGRQSDGPTSLLAALFLLLLQNPFSAGSVGLQLSFGAMAGILLVTPRLYRLLAGDGNHGRIFRYLAAGFSSAIGALALTAPLSGYCFGTLALVSPLSGLLCLPAASAVFLTGLVTVTVYAVCPPLGVLLSRIPALLTAYILAAAHFLARLPGHGIYFANPYVKYWLGLSYALLALAFILRRRIPGRRKYALAAGLAALSLAPALSLGRALYRGPLDAVMLDVGQGQCVLLASDGFCALADCGSGNSWRDAGGLAACQLRSMGYERLDFLILTHYDQDHINGAASLLARMEVGELLAPSPEGREPVLELAEAAGVPAEFIQTRRVLRLGRASVTLFPPLGGGGSNERGLTVLASAGDDDLLITGDMRVSTEEALLETCSLPDIEYLAAGHHGSRHSTGEALLEALAPETVCVSVGPNSYGHPAPETLERLERYGCEIRRTDLEGSIHLTLGRR